MEDALSSFINEIKEFIPDDKINQFKKAVKQLETNLKLSIESQTISKQKNTTVKKVPKDLEQRLFEIFDVESVKFNINEESPDDEIVDTCLKIFNYLDDIEKRNKAYYYNLGFLLSILKSRYKPEKEFLAYAKQTFNRSKTIVNDYIRFYTICTKYAILISCNLSYREIMKNLPEIRDILNEQADAVVC